MRIGFDAKRAFVNKAGLGNYSRDIIRSLQDFYPQNQYVLFTPENNKNLIDPKYCSNIVLPSKKYLSKSLWRSFTLGNQIQENNIDIFHGLSNELPLNIDKCKAIKVVTIHDLIFLRFPELYEYFDRKIYNYKFRFACKNADKIIATSLQTKKDIVELFGVDEHKIEILYQTCNPIFANSVSEDVKKEVRSRNNLPQNYILCVGTIETRKNTLSILKAINEYNIDTSLVLVGRKTPYYNEICKYAKEHNMQSKLITLERVGNNDLPAIYQMADVFIYPSVYEGFGIPILEAFFSGTPVITNKNGSTGEIAGNAAVCLENPNKDNIAEAIKYLLDNPSKREKYSTLGKERSKNFERHIITGNLMNFYKSL